MKAWIDEGINGFQYLAVLKTVNSMADKGKGQGVWVDPVNLIKMDPLAKESVLLFNLENENHV